VDFKRKKGNVHTYAHESLESRNKLELIKKIKAIDA